VNAAGAVIDSLSYEGATIWDADGGTSLQEGAASTGGLADSNVMNGPVCRIPNASNTDVNATDFRVYSTPTPGDINAP
jgi:hypothetical protein